MKPRIHELLLKIIAFFFLFVGGLLFLLGLAMWIEGDPRHYEAGRALAIVSLVLLAPGAYMAYRGKTLSARRRKMRHAAQLARSYRRISPDLLAGKLRCSPLQAEEILLAAVMEGLVRGTMDRTTGEFCVDEAEPIVPTHCAACGASLDGVYYTGDTVKCAHCGSIIR